VGRFEEAARGWARFRRARAWRTGVRRLGRTAFSAAAVITDPSLLLPTDREAPPRPEAARPRWAGRAELASGLLSGPLRARQPDLLRDPIVVLLRAGGAIDGIGELDEAGVRWSPSPDGRARGARDLLVSWVDVIDLELVPIRSGTGLTAWTADGSSLWLRVPSPDDATLHARIDLIRPVRPGEPPSTPR
jgi:hypothetical protein